MDLLLEAWEHQVVYLAGRVLNYKDLARAEAQKAEACVFLTNKNSKCSSEEDYKNILNALSVKKYVYDTNKNTKDDDRHNCRIIM